MLVDMKDAPMLVYPRFSQIIKPISKQVLPSERILSALASEMPLMVRSCFFAV